MYSFIAGSWVKYCKSKQGLMENFLSTLQHRHPLFQTLNLLFVFILFIQSAALTFNSICRPPTVLYSMCCLTVTSLVISHCGHDIDNDSSVYKTLWPQVQIQAASQPRKEDRCTNKIAGQDLNMIQGSTDNEKWST